MILYWFVTGRMAFWEDVGNDGWGQWHFIHGTYIYTVIGEECRVHKTLIGDRKILKLYHSYDKTIKFDLSEVIEKIPRKNDGETFLNFHKQGDKLVSGNLPQQIETNLDHLIDACFQQVIDKKWDQDDLQKFIWKSKIEIE